MGRVSSAAGRPAAPGAAHAPMTNPNPPDDDTIVAISTPPGRGGVGVVRISGPEAVRIALEMFRRPGDTGDVRADEEREGSPSGAPGQALFGSFLTGGREAIDQGYLVIFRPPRPST